METQTSEAPKKKRGRPAKTRTDGGQPQSIQLESLATKVDYLVQLHNEMSTAQTDFKEAIKTVAESAGLNAGTVASFIKAKAGTNFEKRKARVAQLALVFEEVSA